MGIEDLGKQTFKKAEERKGEVIEEQDISKNMKDGVKRAKGFFKAKNYSASFFEYYKALKLISLFYLKKSHGKIADISEDEALTFIAKRGEFGLDEKKLGELRSKQIQIVVSRQEGERKDCIEIGKIVQNAIKKAGI